MIPDHKQASSRAGVLPKLSLPIATWGSNPRLKSSVFSPIVATHEQASSRGVVVPKSHDQEVDGVIFRRNFDPKLGFVPAFPGDKGAWCRGGGANRAVWGRVGVFCAMLWRWILQVAT
mmetsp:Transcript_14910/g.31859  ORF Transcript_14910/g.31859 Transcript_14910/m.31859 type:complete len:118 (-) Transcript_14910:445-798(-)